MSDFTDITDFDKDQLAEYAKNVFSVELDMRNSLKTLKDEVTALQTKRDQKDVAVNAAAAPTHLLNRDNGRVFIYTDMLAKHLTNAVACDEDGNPV